MMEMLKIEVNTFGGAPFADHNMPCAVCGEKKAVLELWCGRFQPCWECQRKGWKLRKKVVWWKRIFGVK